IIECVILRY
ncbi:hypothetical protein D029_4832B, partial [Vibrio parahaemolyticus 970107]